MAVRHYAWAQTTVTLSSSETEFQCRWEYYRFLECGVKTGSNVTMVTDSVATKSMASRKAVSRATKHIRLRCL